MTKQNVLNEKKSPRILALLGGSNSCSSNSKIKAMIPWFLLKHQVKLVESIVDPRFNFVKL